MIQLYESPRLLLRTLSPRYADLVLEFYEQNRKDFEKYEPARPFHFYTANYHKQVLEMEQDYYAKGLSYRLWAFRKEDPLHIVGTISLRNVMRGSYQKCEVGYKIDQADRRQGYGLEMVRTGCNLAFNEFHLHRIEAICMPNNTPSIHLLNKLGFTQEGRLRRYVEINGSYEDHLLFSLLRQENAPNILGF